MPTFSVVIPCYNGESTVRAAVQSVINQTAPAREVILIDDGSIDNSVEIIREQFQDVTIFQQSNSGVSEARNVGVSIATSDYVAFLDADDIWMAHHLEALTMAALHFPSHLMLGTMAPRRRVDVEINNVPCHCPTNVAPRSVDFFRAARRRRVAGVINMSCVAFKRNVFYQYGFSFPLVNLSEDDALFCEVAALSNLALFPKPTTLTRRSSASVTASVRVDTTSVDCNRWLRAAHAQVATRVALDNSVAPARRTSAGRFRDDLLVRHWITVAANRHQRCARVSLAVISGNWSLNAIAFRAVAFLPRPLAAAVAPAARLTLRAAGLPLNSPFHRRRVKNG